MNSATFPRNAVYDFAGKKNARHAKFQSLYFDSRGYAVSTDGHRLFATSEMFDSEKSGKLYQIDDLIKKGEFVESRETFPRWEETIPTGIYDIQLKIKIPEWFEVFSGYEKEILLTVDYEDKSKPKFISGSFLTETCFGINGRFLAPFAGREVQLLVHNDTSAILLVSPEVKLEEAYGVLTKSLLELEWFAIIMPVRLDPELRPHPQHTKFFV